MNRLQHEKWLKKHNVHPEQIKARKKNRRPEPYQGPNVASDYYGNLTNTIVGSFPVVSIWETIRMGQENNQTIHQIKEKATKVAIPYNKGSLQYLPEKEMQNAGKKL